MLKHLLAVVAAAALALAIAGPAAAGVYPMRSCNVPGQLSAGTGPWTWENVPNSISYNQCASAGGFGFGFPNAPVMAPASSAVLGLVRPGNGPQTAIGIRQVQLWLRARLASSGSAVFVTSHAVRGGNIQQTDILGPGAPAAPVEWTSPVFDQRTDAFRLLLFCSTSASTSCTLADRVPLEVLGSQVSLYESALPTIRITGGALLSGRRQSGLASVTYEASDDESGIARVEALLSGRVVASSDFTQSGRCRYDSWNACDGRVAGDLVADTSAVPDGVHTLKLRATDAAGNERIVEADEPVVVATGGDDPLDSPNGAGATNDVHLTASFVLSGSRTLFKSWGSAAIIRGRLRQGSGAPVAAARLDVTARTTRQGAWTDGRMVTTDADGRFRIVLPRRVSSRHIRIVYRPSLTSSLAAAARQLELRVRAAVSLRVSLKGIHVHYSGRLGSSPIPTRGKVLHIQGRALGGAWQTFAVRRTTRDGRFDGHYRLRVRRPGVRLQFRVRVPVSSNYAFATGHSPTVTRRVR